MTFSFSRMLAGKSRILVWSRVIPGPAVESAFLDVRNVVGNEIVAQGVAFIHRYPELACLRMHGQAGSISNAGCVDPLPSSVRVELEHIGAVSFRFTIGNVRLGADTDIEFLAVVRKH